MSGLELLSTHFLHLKVMKLIYAVLWGKRYSPPPTPQSFFSQIFRACYNCIAISMKKCSDELHSLVPPARIFEPRAFHVTSTYSKSTATQTALRQRPLLCVTVSCKVPSLNTSVLTSSNQRLAVISRLYPHYFHFLTPSIHITHVIYNHFDCYSLCGVLYCLRFNK